MAAPRTKVSADSEAAFARLAASLSKDPRVDRPETARAKGFGSKGLKVARKLFAFHSKGRLVVKLPADRVESLASSGQGKPFDPGHGRLMKEWLAVDFSAQSLWPALAREALAFAVPSRPPPPRRAARGRKRARRATRRK
jgi:hypothetical protein